MDEKDIILELRTTKWEVVTHTWNPLPKCTDTRFLTEIRFGGSDKWEVFIDDLCEGQTFHRSDSAGRRVMSLMSTEVPAKVFGEDFRRMIQDGTLPFTTWCEETGRPGLYLSTGGWRWQLRIVTGGEVVQTDEDRPLGKTVCLGRVLSKDGKQKFVERFGRMVDRTKRDTPMITKEVAYCRLVKVKKDNGEYVDREEDRKMIIENVRANIEEERRENRKHMIPILIVWIPITIYVLFCLIVGIAKALIRWFG